MHSLLLPLLISAQKSNIFKDFVEYQKNQKKTVIPYWCDGFF